MDKYIVVKTKVFRNRLLFCLELGISCATLYNWVKINKVEVIIKNNHKYYSLSNGYVIIKAK